MTSRYEFITDSNISSLRSDQNEYERDILCILHESLPNLPMTSADLIDQLRKNLNADISIGDIHKILEKLAAQDIVKLVSFFHYVVRHRKIFYIFDTIKINFIYF